MLAFLVMGANTLARPKAILDTRPLQFDAEHDLLDLNRPGREQNNKLRPIVPVTPTPRPWLDQNAGEMRSLYPPSQQVDRPHLARAETQ